MCFGNCDRSGMDLCRWGESFCRNAVDKGKWKGTDCNYSGEKVTEKRIMKELSTLCYIKKDGKYLMLHRTVKENDVNKDKWIGVEDV